MDDDYIFVHKCVTDGCDRNVEFDDEPWCFTHSPDEGSSLRGYSARAMAAMSKENQDEELKRLLEASHAS